MQKKKKIIQRVLYLSKSLTWIRVANLQFEGEGLSFFFFLKKKKMCVKIKAHIN